MSDHRRHPEKSRDRAREASAPYDQRQRSHRPDRNVDEHPLPGPSSSSSTMQHYAPRPMERRQVPMGSSSSSVNPQPIGHRPMEPAASVRGISASTSVAIRNRPINPELLKTRPSHCLTKKAPDGEPIVLQANYFKLLSSTDWCLFKYRVDFEPDEERIFARKGMLKPHGQTLGEYIFDGTVMYTSHRLPESMKLKANRKSDGCIIDITIRFVGDMMKGDEHYLQFYNIIMRKCQEHLQLQLVGRNFYDARSKVEVQGHRLELWPGYLTSIRQYENNILMCSEIVYKVMRQETLLDILNDCYRKYGPSEYQMKYSAEVIGLTVLTYYNNLTYRIEDVKFEESPMSTFTRKNDEITYKDYYMNKHQINLRDFKQPLLLSRSKNRDRRAEMDQMVYLVPELCSPTGITDEMRSNQYMMRDLANHTRLNPNTRINKLMNFNDRLQSKSEVVRELGNWRLELDTKLVDIPARVLQPELIVFSPSIKKSSGAQANWTNEVRYNRMLEIKPLDTWTIIVPDRFKNDAEIFVQTMRQSVKSMEFPIATPDFYILNNDSNHAYPSAIEEIMRTKSPPPQLITCIVSNNRADRYTAIKKKCCMDRPIATQCLLAKNLNGKGVASIATKVAVQLTCKIGGIPWTVAIYSTSLMVVGFDVCRDSNNKACSYGALVASIDKKYGKYFSAISPHTSDEELSRNLAENMTKALSSYKKENRELPKKIVVYRVGVSDGQIPWVCEHEVKHLTKKLAEIYGSEDEVKLAYILVTKRLNTRIFANKDNPPPGTVVDDVITNPLKYDFFLVSQHVRQGSVSPTGYNIVYDTCGYSPSVLQRLTWKLTHLYFNWSGTIRVPAPCQYAQKLAFFVSQSLHAIPSPHLQTVLYYL